MREIGKITNLQTLSADLDKEERSVLINNDKYFEVLESVKTQIQDAQYRAILGVNREQILLFWNIGKVIIENSEWGSKFIDNLARDIKSEFPNATGYSVRNFKYMKKFATTFPEIEFVQEPLAQLTWYHLQALMDKIPDRCFHLVCRKNLGKWLVAKCPCTSD